MMECDVKECQDTGIYNETAPQLCVCLFACREFKKHWMFLHWSLNFAELSLRLAKIFCLAALLEYYTINGL